MFKKTLVVVCVLVVLVGMMVIPASASESVFASNVWWLDYNDYVTNVTTSGGYDFVTVKFPLEFLRVRVYSVDGMIAQSPKESSSPAVSVWLPGSELQRDANYRIFFGLCGGYKLWLENIPAETECTLTATISIDQSHHTPDHRFSVSYVNELDGHMSDDYVDYGKQLAAGAVTVTGNLSPWGFGCSVGLSLRNFGLLNDGDCNFELQDFEIKLKIATGYRAEWVNGNAETTAKKNEILLKNQTNMLNAIQEEQKYTNEMLEDMPEEFGDEMQGVIDSEKQEASDAGDSAAGELMDMIPNESQGFMDAIQSLVSSMSYSGTDAKLPIPAITIPAIPGVMDAIHLTDELSVDFGYWVQQLPGGVLKLVQILCTIALIVYCFKELYGMIAYAMTLKGGGSSE